ncbi:hypothetical protein PVK06_023513 [Gossypium arboreum]|uniref:Uncharacterized protein n=1 Tax=Gossypium arboreum TaxID=29729 RepID=A0ABR0PBA3_GOSAR|nr:hypothetical protein PVK06_023513 [Gossypium arboreum]
MIRTVITLDINTNLTKRGRFTRLASGKGKGVIVGHKPKVGQKVLKSNNSIRDLSRPNQQYFDDGSAIARDKMKKVIKVGGFELVQISSHLNSIKHQAIRFGGDDYTGVSSIKESMGMMIELAWWCG